MALVVTEIGRDGTTDATAAIRTAIAACRANGIALIVDGGGRSRVPRSRTSRSVPQKRDTTHQLPKTASASSASA